MLAAGGKLQMPHFSVDLELCVDKPENVWRYIYAWQESECSHDFNVRYLFLHALVQWGSDKSHLENVYTIVIQYSTEIGKNVDISQPAHIVEKDVSRVLNEFQKFVETTRSKK